MDKRTLSTILCVLLFVGLSCSSDKNDYEKAQQMNTIQAFEEFIQKHPESGFTELAHAKIDSMRYQIVELKDSIEAYEGFIKEYPESRFKAHVQERVKQLELSNVENRYRFKKDGKVLTTLAENLLATGSHLQVDGKGNWTFTLPQKKIVIGDLTFADSLPRRVTILVNDRTLLADKEGITAKDKSGRIWISHEVELDGKKVKAFFASK